MWRLGGMLIYTTHTHEHGGNISLKTGIYTDRWMVFIQMLQVNTFWSANFFEAVNMLNKDFLTCQWCFPTYLSRLFRSRILVTYNNPSSTKIVLPIAISVCPRLGAWEQDWKIYLSRASSARAIVEVFFSPLFIFLLSRGGRTPSILKKNVVLDSDTVYKA